LVVNPNNPEDIDTDGEDHCYDEAALLCMARPLGMHGANNWDKTLNEVRRPPKDISEVAFLELQNIRKGAEECEIW
jgi:hypothetical protein